MELGNVYGSGGEKLRDITWNNIYMVNEAMHNVDINYD